jgi:uncharacterized membrane protein YbhN (UPF0104 family)
MWWGLDKTRKFLSAIAVYANFPAWDLLLLIGAGITRHLIGIVAFMAFALAVGIQMSFLDLGWIRSLISLFSMLPFSIAGGLGVREVSLVALLSAFGISAAQALSFSLLFFARDVIIGLVGGLLEFLQASRINSPIK